jgi:hypothetical protein
LVHPEAAEWAPENTASFQKTPEANFVVLEINVENGRGERVSEHWIARLEPQTNRVLGLVCREEAQAIGSLGCFSLLPHSDPLEGRKPIAEKFASVRISFEFLCLMPDQSPPRGVSASRLEWLLNPARTADA